MSPRCAKTQLRITHKKALEGSNDDDRVRSYVRKGESRSVIHFSGFSFFSALFLSPCRNGQNQGWKREREREALCAAADCPAPPAPLSVCLEKGRKKAER